MLASCQVRVSLRDLVLTFSGSSQTSPTRRPSGSWLPEDALNGVEELEGTVAVRGPPCGAEAERRAQHLGKTSRGGQNKLAPYQ